MSKTHVCTAILTVYTDACDRRFSNRQQSYHQEATVHTNSLAFYRPQTKLQEGNGFTPVCDSVHRGGVSQRAMGSGCTLADTTSPRQTPPPQTATEAGGTHPTGMHSCSVKILQRCIGFCSVCHYRFAVYYAICLAHEVGSFSSPVF